MSSTMSSERLASVPGHLQGFALMHVAMRRDARRLTAAAPVLAAADHAPVRDWWHRLRAVIDWHHHSEDDVLWPELLRLLPRSRGQAARLTGHHTELDAAMDAVGAALDGGTGPAAVVPAADRFTRVLHDHLREEEEIVFPLFLQLPEREYLSLERRVLRSAPRSVLALLPPWMFDGAEPAAVANVSATMPPPVRLLGRTVLRRRYERGLPAIVTSR